VDWTYWKSAEITRRMDAIAGDFSLTLADRWTDGAQALPIAAGMRCEILIGADPVIAGYVDKVGPSFSARDHGVTVSGRDRSADLVDCSAVHRPGQWRNQTALQLAAILAAPFGVPVTAEGDVGAPIAAVKLEQGETAFEALDRILKQRELLACPDGRGGLVLLRAGARTHAAALRQGENVLSASARFDMADRYSEYLVQGQQPGTDDAFGEAACAVHAASRDPAVTRYRPLIVRAEGNVDSAEAARRAAWERTVRAARAAAVTVAVQGFRQGGDAAAPLWQINAMTEVHIPFLRMSQRLVTGAVTFRRDASGSTTVLELKDPAAFRPEPKRKDPDQEGGIGRDVVIEAERDLQTRFAEDAAGQQRRIAEGRRP
jgi:prophage tail gpP-like protein